MNTTVNRNHISRHGRRRLKTYWKLIFSVCIAVMLATAVVWINTPSTVHVDTDDSSESQKVLTPSVITKTIPTKEESSNTDPESVYWKKVYTDVSKIDESEWDQEYKNFGHYQGPIEFVDSDSKKLSNSDIDTLTQFVLSEAKIFEGTDDCNKIMQYVAATAYNRIGQNGFGPEGTYADSLTTVLSNKGQYRNVLDYLDKYDANDEVARANVLAVVNGEVHTPDNLYFEDCSNIYYIDFDASECYVNSDGDFIWTYDSAKADAEAEFKSHYSSAEEFKVVYSALSPEGRFLMFGTNPYGAYATDPNGAN